MQLSATGLSRREALELMDELEEDRVLEIKIIAPIKKSPQPAGTNGKQLTAAGATRNGAGLI